MDPAITALSDQLATSARRKLPEQVAAAKERLAKCLGNEGQAIADLYLHVANTLGPAGTAALAAAALVELAGLERVDDVLREYGIEYPLGARGVRDLAAQAAGRAEDLETARAQYKTTITALAEQVDALKRADWLIAKVRTWRGQHLAALAGNHDGILTAAETLIAELAAFDVADRGAA